MGRKKKKQLKPWCWYPLSVGSRGRAAARVGGDGDGEAWRGPMAASVWDLGLGVGNWAAGIRFAKSSRKMGPLGREALAVAGRWTP